MTNNEPRKTRFLRQLLPQKDDNNEAIPINNQTQNTDDFMLLKYYISLAKHHPDLIVVLSKDGEILSQNISSINNFLGLPEKNSLAYNEIFSKRTISTLKNAFYNTLKGHSEEHNLTIEKESEENISTSLTFIPIMGRNEIDRVHLVVKDITEYERIAKDGELREKHLIHAQQIAEVGSWEYVINDDQLFCSDFFYDIFGFSKMDDVPMKKPFNYVHPDDYHAAYEKVSTAITTGVRYISEFRIYHGRTNEIRYIKVQAEVTWEGNKPYKLIGVVKDLTSYKQLEMQLIDQNENLKHIYDNIRAGFWHRESVNGKVTYASKGLEDILKTPLSRLYEEPDFWKQMIVSGHQNEVFKAHETLSEGKSIYIRYRIVDGEKTTKWILEQTIPTINAKGEIESIFGMVTDVSHETELQEKLKLSATHDPLTKLPNQRSLHNKLNTLCEDDGKPFSILSLDLDRFNMINDSLGYQIGDETLKKIASRILSEIPEDGYLARLNSDNFIIILEDFSSKDNVLFLAEEILKTVENKLFVKEYELHILSSIGISFFPDHGDNKQTLLENVQSALYHAKRQGKNRYQLYSFSQNISSYKKYILEQDMRKAIINEEFELYYQPQINTNHGTIEGAEALIRWHHEEWGTVSPGEFIPLAEENHLIHQISDWVIKQVCAQLRIWKNRGQSILPISINISPIRFLKKGLAKLVKEQLELHQIPAHYLELEITEESLLKSEPSILATIANLKQMGVKVAIDDFGTGYASLHYLRQFQVDTIKIDQVFIQSSDEMKEIDQAIVSSILHLAKTLDIRIVAEGVETYSQYKYLKQKECDLIQGYLFSKPVSLHKFEQMLQTGYLLPINKQFDEKPKVDRRNFYRFEFPYYVLGEMEILELNKKKVDLSSAKVLIENISLGGCKILSSLKLPINTDLKLRYYFKVLNEQYAVDGSLVWINEGRESTFYYGVKFNLSVLDEDRLARIINKLTALRKLNQEIPDTNFIYQNAYSYFKNNQI